MPPAPTSGAPRAIAGTLLAGAAVHLALWLAAPLGIPLLHGYGQRFPAVVAASVLACLAPRRWRAHADTLAVVAVFIAFHVGRSTLGMVLPPALAVVAWRAPLERATLRRALLVLVPVAFAVAYAAHDAARATLPEATMFQFLAVCHALGTRGRRDLGSVVRAMCVNNVFAAPVPVEDTWATDPTARSRLVGGAWIVLGGGLYVVDFVLQIRADPWGALLAGDGAWPVHAILLWTKVVLYVSGLLFLEAGTLRMLGLEVRAPVRAPWSASNFVAYWRSFNVFNYKLMYEAYLGDLLRPTERWMGLGVVLVFLISGALHTLREPFAPLVWARWSVDGVITAATLAVLLRGARARVKAYVDGHPPRRRSPALGFATYVVGVLFVMIVHGLLMQLTWDEATLRRALRWR